MKKLIALFALLFVAPALASAQAVVTHENYVFHWDGVWDDPATVGCLGEPLMLTGPLHVVLHETTDKAGNYHYMFHYQPQGLEVVGMESGDSYMALGVTRGEVKMGGVNDPFYLEGFINNAPVIKPGTGFVLNVAMRFHVTINPNGEETAFLDVVDVRCK